MRLSGRHHGTVPTASSGRSATVASECAPHPAVERDDRRAGLGGGGPQVRVVLRVLGHPGQRLGERTTEHVAEVARLRARGVLHQAEQVGPRRHQGPAGVVLRHALELPQQRLSTLLQVAVQVVLLARRHGSDCGRAHRQARRRAFDSCRWRRLPCATCQARTPRSCWPASTPSSARSRRRCAGPSPSSPGRGRARRGPSRTGSRTAWRPGSTVPPRCWPSRSPPAPRVSCAAGSSSSGPTACRRGRSTPRPCASCSTSGPARTAATSRRSSTTGCRWSPSPPDGCGSASTPPGCATWSPRSRGPRSATSAPRTTPGWPSSTTAASPRSTRRPSRGSSPATRRPSATGAGSTSRTSCCARRR